VLWQGLGMVTYLELGLSVGATGIVAGIGGFVLGVRRAMTLGIEIMNAIKEAVESDGK
jgi:hypothetical protein